MYSQVSNRVNFRVVPVSRDYTMSLGSPLTRAVTLPVTESRSTRDEGVVLLLTPLLVSGEYSQAHQRRCEIRGGRVLCTDYTSTYLPTYLTVRETHLP
jgi:hypothetical protein